MSKEDVMRQAMEETARLAGIVLRALRAEGISDLDAVIAAANAAGILATQIDPTCVKPEGQKTMVQLVLSAINVGMLFEKDAPAEIKEKLRG